MVDIDEVDERLRAVERALTEDGRDGAAPADGADLAARLDAVEEEVERLTERVDDLAASTQAVRGYVGNVRSVNEEIERRADAALSAVESLEEQMGERDGAQEGTRQPSASDDRAGGAAVEGTAAERGVAGRTARRVMDEAAARDGQGAAERPTRQRHERGRRRGSEATEADREDDEGLLAGLRGTL